MVFYCNGRFTLDTPLKGSVAGFWLHGYRMFMICSVKEALQAWNGENRINENQAFHFDWRESISLSP